MNRTDYSLCRRSGCQKMVMHKTGLCGEHRKRKCDWFKCPTKITARQGAKYCDKHKKASFRQEPMLWSVSV